MPIRLAKAHLRQRAATFCVSSHSLVFGVAVALLAACVKPRHSRPAPPIPNRWCGRGRLRRRGTLRGKTSRRPPSGISGGAFQRFMAGSPARRHSGLGASPTPAWRRPGPHCWCGPWRTGPGDSRTRRKATTQPEDHPSLERTTWCRRSRGIDSPEPSVPGRRALRESSSSMGTASSTRRRSAARAAARPAGVAYEASTDRSVCLRRCRTSHLRLRRGWAPHRSLSEARGRAGGIQFPEPSRANGAPIYLPTRSIIACRFLRRNGKPLAAFGRSAYGWAILRARQGSASTVMETLRCRRALYAVHVSFPMGRRCSVSVERRHPRGTLLAPQWPVHHDDEDAIRRIFTVQPAHLRVGSGVATKGWRWQRSDRSKQ